MHTIKRRPTKTVNLREGEPDTARYLQSLKPLSMWIDTIGSDQAEELESFSIAHKTNKEEWDYSTAESIMMKSAEYGSTLL